MLNGVVVDLEFFLDGFGIWVEIIIKIKEMGFIGKIFMLNVDEFFIFFDFIK